MTRPTTTKPQPQGVLTRAASFTFGVTIGATILWGLLLLPLLTL